MPRGYLHELLFTEPPGRFALGQFLPLSTAEEVDEIRNEGRTGWWECDIQDDNKLTWSDEVYDLFGIARATPVEREQAVLRYREHSRGVLERVRRYAIDRSEPFVLDAEIDTQSEASSWIRIVAVPVVEGDRVTALRGLKWML